MKQLESIFLDHPPVSFQFLVVIADAKNGDVMGGLDSSFSEVSGITVELQTEELEEGGEHGTVHKLPKFYKPSNLILKRGLVNVLSPLGMWINSTLSNGFDKGITMKNIDVILIDRNSGADPMPLRRWSFQNVYPVKWSLSDLNASESKIAIESIEFAYKYMTIL